MKKILLLYNPLAGRGEIRHSLAKIIEQFSAANYDVVVYPTKAAGDAILTIRARADEFDLIVCCGGDGTLGEVVTGLMECGSSCPVGYIPSGSTNDFATTLGIPRQKEQAVDLILSGEPFQCDIGQFNKEEYFVYVAAFGLMTDVSYQTGQEMKNLLGHAAYLIEGVKRLGNMQSYELEVESEEFTGKENFIFGMVTNSDSVGGFKGLPGANVELNDGLFEVMLVRTPLDLTGWQNVIGALILNDQESESIIRFKTNRIVFRSEEPVAWTRDGENGGEHSLVELENIPKALSIMVGSQKEQEEIETDRPSGISEQ